jgi:dTDP-4-amino-4,6-dideoxygalactose transaminase
VQAALGPRSRALVAVHLFGRFAPMDELRRLTDRHGLLLVEDAAHAAGLGEGPARAGALGDAAAFSFYPTKVLAALGDGGAVVTGDAELAAGVRRLRSYGWSEWQGAAPAPGVNSRLDEIQAAVLRVRLGELPPLHERLRKLAGAYRRELAPASGLSLPAAPACGEIPWHQFVISHPERDRLRAALRARGIATAVHYEPLPPHLEAFGTQTGFPEATALAASALSLPFDPWLTEAQVSEVGAAVVEAIGKRERSVT